MDRRVLSSLIPVDRSQDLDDLWSKEPENRFNRSRLTVRRSVICCSHAVKLNFSMSYYKLQALKGT